MKSVAMLLAEKYKLDKTQYVELLEAVSLLTDSLIVRQSADLFPRNTSVQIHAEQVEKAIDHTEARLIGAVKDVFKLIRNGNLIPTSL